MVLIKSLLKLCMFKQYGNHTDIYTFVFIASPNRLTYALRGLTSNINRMAGHINMYTYTRICKQDKFPLPLLKANSVGDVHCSPHSRWH